MSSPETRTEQNVDPEFFTHRSNLYTTLSRLIGKARELDDAAVRDLINKSDSLLRTLELLDTKPAVEEALVPVVQEVCKILKTSDPQGKPFKLAADAHLENWEKVY